VTNQTIGKKNVHTLLNSKLCLLYIKRVGNFEYNFMPVAVDEWTAGRPVWIWMSWTSTRLHGMVPKAPFIP